MGNKLDTLQEICTLATKQVEDLYPDLQMVFIPHQRGMFHEVIETSEHEVSAHPAGDIAQSILEKNNNREYSSFIGMAVRRETKWLGLASKEHMLAVFNVNIDEFTSAKELRRTIYHMIWQAIDISEMRKHPEYASKFRTGPLIPKRSPMNAARVNLQADVFSAAMCGLQGDGEAIEAIALTRATDSLSPVHHRRAEEYPYPIAMEATRYAFDELAKVKPVRAKFSGYARELTLKVSYTFNEESISNWWSYCNPAQDLAWRDTDKATILGYAMFTSEDPYIRSMGHLVSEITTIEPVGGMQLPRGYNPYANEQHNQEVHIETMDKTFEDAVAKGIDAQSGQPLIAAANEQNENLADGNIIGWCANALQAAAKGFEIALSTGSSPVQAARLEFEGTKTNSDWDMLKKIGESIIGKKRNGFAVTLGNIAELCSENKALGHLLNSIKTTMSDPTYIRKLEAANDFLRGSPAPLPAAAPRIVQSHTIAGPAPAGPGLGSNSAHIAHVKKMMERAKQDQESGKTTGDDQE